MAINRENSNIRADAYTDYEAVCDFGRAALRHHDRDADLEAIASIHNVIHRAELAQRASVTLARAEGHGWLAIGMALGVSKQAAQQKYGQDVITYAELEAMHQVNDEAGDTPSMFDPAPERAYLARLAAIKAEQEA